ncbi:MAG: M20/M25/M40 family metallo-hydrolase [Ilumatobacteraceae bacterium]
MGTRRIDMLNLTSSMAVVAFRHLARTGFRPKGTLIYFGVADEEAGGRYGAEWMLEHHWDAVGADYVLTESGGWSSLGADGVRRVVVNVAEKGLAYASSSCTHAGPRVAAARGGQRPAEGGRDAAGSASTRRHRSWATFGGPRSRLRI